jgi:uncharacterized MnhB-related membrane protein
MLHLLVAIAAICCAYQVMRAKRLLLATLWLAVTSALVALLLYMIGAPDVAVIELSVGAGLVTILFVFAFSIVGEDTMDKLTIVPRPLVWVLILLVSFILGWYTLPLAGVPNLPGEASFTNILWEQRGLDVLAQVVLIFSGALGLLGLLAESRIVTVSRIPLENVAEQSTGNTTDGQFTTGLPSNGPQLESEAILEETH